MACGINLGTFLLICWFQVEHVRCLWATQAQGSQRPGGNAYVGFSQQYSGRAGGSNPQNKFRQASVSPGSARSSSSSSSSNLQPQLAVGSAYNRGFSSSGYTQTASQPAHSGRAPVRLAQSSSVSNPSWKMTDSRRVGAQSVPKSQFGLSTAIASGHSVSKYNQNRGTPAKQGTRHTNQHPPRKSASPQKPAYAKAAYPRSSQSSTLFSAGGPVPEHVPVRQHTSATARARRVSVHSKAAASKPSNFLVSQTEKTRNRPSQTADGRFKSKLLTVTGGSALGGYESASNTASSYTRFSPRSPGGSRAENDGYSSAKQTPGHGRPASLRWSARNQGEGGLHGAGGSSKKFSPTRTHSIPDRFGGFAIRRLSGSSDKKQVVQAPQLKHTAPSRQTASFKPQGESSRPEVKWVSRLHQ